jgi:DNA-binding response OmpR family regulator
MGSAKKILIVEDDESIREALMDLLQGEGYLISVAANGQIGIDFLRQAEELPSLILLDLMMPVKDGFTFREEQLGDDRLNKVPVLVMSADPTMLTKKDRLKANVYMKKPLEISQMLRSIAELVA